MLAGAAATAVYAGTPLRGSGRFPVSWRCAGNPGRALTIDRVDRRVVGPVDMPELLASYAAGGGELRRSRRDRRQPAAGSAGGAWRAVAGHDLDVLAASLMHDMAAIGMTFRSIEGDERFVVDPVPRVIPADEWARLEAGLAQRVRALNAFVADVYGERRIVNEGVVPERVVETAPTSSRSWMASARPNDIWIGVAGPGRRPNRVGRVPGAGGQRAQPERVHLRAGHSRDAEGSPRRRRRPSGKDAGRDAGLACGSFTAAAPDAARDEPQAVVISDGLHSSAYWEHRWVATHLAIPLAEPHELEQRDRRFWLRPPGARDRRRIDVVYNRTSTDHLDSALGQLLLEPLRAGTLGMGNAFGVGVADDKLTHAYVEEMVRFYLGEEPALGSVQTLDLGRPEVLEEALDHFEELVIKPRRGYGGIGVVICRDADPAAVEAARQAVRAHPAGYIAQRLVCLSTHPTVIDGRFARRHVDLRPYVFLGPDERVHVMPGGVTRVALEDGALIVNASQNGGAKDTWVLR